ncbi:putative serine/threonine-protein kinase [Sesbania bispinosa]|nr:putative serine/threonine-protein kinase [Sesbania bispinosa]
MGSLIVNAQGCYIERWDQNKDLVDFKEYPNVNWPLNDYDQLMAINNDAGQCWKKRYPLSNGRKHPNINGTIALVKEAFESSCNNNNKVFYIQGA